MTTTTTEQNPDAGNVWALILAAGDGTRLRSLTTTAGGLTIPKQFCSLHGGASLFEEALQRAQSVARHQHVTTVVAARHRQWWEAPLRELPRNNVIVQPENKGTAAGLLLPLLHIMERDPDAIVAILPADHFVREESILANSLRQATRLARADRRHVYMLGLAPDHLDPELGYIVADRGAPLGGASVRRFVEKPSPDLAQTLIDAGALWNAFILAASARALLQLYTDRFPDLTAAMAAAVNLDRDDPRLGAASHGLYEDLMPLDFSRDILEGQEGILRVVKVPACGWNDLGTPQRVADTLTRHRPRHFTPTRGPHTAYLSLADQHQRLCAG